MAAYNEKDTLRTLMDRLIAKSIDGVNIEIVLVESNSSDGTREDAVRYSGHPRVRFIPEDRPRGKGHAVRAGLAACTGDVVLFQDADLEYDIDDYDDLIAPLLAYRRNFVIGSRHVSKGRRLEDPSVQRRGRPGDGLQSRARVLSRAVQLHVPPAPARIRSACSRSSDASVCTG